MFMEFMTILHLYEIRVSNFFYHVSSSVSVLLFVFETDVLSLVDFPLSPSGHSSTGNPNHTLLLPPAKVHETQLRPLLLFYIDSYSIFFFFSVKTPLCSVEFDDKRSTFPCERGETDVKKWRRGSPRLSLD